MYNPTYGFGQGLNGSTAPQQQLQQQQQQQQQQQLQQQQQQQVMHQQPQAGYHPNAQVAAPQPSPQHLLGQPPQHIMYNQQQFGQNLYGSMGVNPGMMQSNNGLAHMPANNGVVQGYQTPYTSSPYGAGIASSTGGPSTQLSYMTPTSNVTTFAMNAANMTPQQQQQQQQQRMQPPPVSTPASSAQRVSPYGGTRHNTPPQPQGQAQAQFMTPGNPSSNQSQQIQTPLQTPNQNASQVQQASGQKTPQTPNFPPNSAGGSGGAIQTPLSPASEFREKERVSLLLDINRELLMEVMRLQSVQVEAKKESTSSTTPTTAEDGAGGEFKLPEKPTAAQTGKEFVECMRRLQANLAYLAAIADRSHKPSSNIPPHPAIISAPPLSPLPPKPQIKSSPKAASPKQNSNVKPESSTPSHSVNGPATLNGTEAEETEDRLVTLKGLYARLQALFPGVDPKKEPPIQSASKNAPQKGPAPRPNPNPNPNPNAHATNPNPPNQTPSQWQNPSNAGQPQPQQQQQQQQMMAGSMGMPQAQGQGQTMPMGMGAVNPQGQGGPGPGPMM